MNFEARGYILPPTSTIQMYTDEQGIANDLTRYLYGETKKVDALNNGVTLDFSLVPLNQTGSLDLDTFRPHRGDYLRIQTGVFGLWYTGVITNEPELSFVGQDPATKKPVWAYQYKATSDEVILNQQPIGLMNPFLNTTHGQIVKTLADRLAPGLFDYTGVQDGPMVSRYVVDPTKKFSEIISDIAGQANYRFYAKDHKLYYQPLDFQPAAFNIDGLDKTFTPSNLSMKTSTDPIINDAIVFGAIEPQGYMNEYFVGDGIEAQFPLAAAMYGADSFVLLDEQFSGSAINSTNWSVFDSPQSWLVVDSGFLNVRGGNQNNAMDVYLQSASLVPLEGHLRITHGEFDFVSSGSANSLGGIIGGLWTDTPAIDTTQGFADGAAAYKNCLYGFQAFNGVTPGSIYLQAVIAGAIQPYADRVDIDTSKRYVMRTVIDFYSMMRFRQDYTFLASDGSVSFLGGSGTPTYASAYTVLTAIDPLTGTMTSQKTWTHFIPQIDQSKLFAYYMPVVANDIHFTVTNITISTPLQAALEIKPAGTDTWGSQIIGPNDVDALDGESPVATVVLSASGSSGNTGKVPGTMPYNPGNATLQFFKDSTQEKILTAGKGDLVHLRYRRAGVAIGRAQDKLSIRNEASFGDSGLRSTTSNDLSPQPRTSQECEFAAAALVQQNNAQHYTGNYVTYNVLGLQSEPVSGTILKFMNLPVSVFPNPVQLPIPPAPTGEVDPVSGEPIFDNGDANTYNFYEQITQVTTTLMLAKGNTEIYQHDVAFGPPDYMKRVLANFAAPSDVFVPQDTSDVPIPIDISVIGQADVADVVGPKFTGYDANSVAFDANQDPPNDGGFEIRYSDDSWGVDDSKNLVTRITSGRTWTVPRTARGRVCFIRAYDTRNLIHYSEDATKPSWLTLPGSDGSTPAITIGMTVNPDGNRSLVNTLRLGPGAGISQVLNVASRGTQIVGTVGVKGPAGTPLILQFRDFQSGSGAGVVYATKTYTLNGAWQRIDVAGLGGDTLLYSPRLEIVNGGSVAQTIELTRVSAEVNRTVESVYCKTLDSPHGAYSRYSAGLQVKLPLKPPMPSGTVDGTDVTAPVVTLNLPNIETDVWGIEIRDADNVTVLYAKDLIADDFQNTWTNTGNVNRRQLFNLYTYNLLGEYSDPFLLDFTIPLPQASDVLVQESDHTLRWDSIGGKGALIEMFSDAAYTNVVHNFGNVLQSLALPDDAFFPLRYFQVTPYDDLGPGIAVRVSHEYVPSGIITFDVGQIQNAPPPPAPNTSASPPPPMQTGTVTPPRPNLWADEGWSNYQKNRRRTVS